MGWQDNGGKTETGECVHEETTSARVPRAKFCLICLIEGVQALNPTAPLNLYDTSEQRTKTAARYRARARTSPAARATERAAIAHASARADPERCKPSRRPTLQRTSRRVATPSTAPLNALGTPPDALHRVTSDIGTLRTTILCRRSLLQRHWLRLKISKSASFAISLPATSDKAAHRRVSRRQ